MLTRMVQATRISAASMGKRPARNGRLCSLVSCEIRPGLGIAQSSRVISVSNVIVSADAESFGMDDIGLQ